eukprot:4842805-Amphidinium_carterae.1
MAGQNLMPLFEGASTTLQEDLTAPLTAVEGLGESFETQVVQLQDPGTLMAMDEQCEVAIPYAGASLLKDSLAESSPADAPVLTLAMPESPGLPSAPNVVEVLDLPEEFGSGTIAKTVLQADSTTRVVVHHTGAAEDELNYITAVSGADDEPANPLLVLSTPAARRCRTPSTNVTA